MRKWMRQVLSVSSALVVLVLAVGSAGAVEMTVAPAGEITATAGRLTFEGEGIAITCPVTLRANVLRGPIPVRAEAQYGEVTGVAIGLCSGGSIERPLHLPWRILVSRSLPEAGSLTPRNTTGVLSVVVGAAVNLGVFSGIVNCLHEGTLGGLATLTHTAGESTSYFTRSIASLEVISVPLVRGGFGCPANAHFAGSLTFTAIQTVTLS